MKSLVPHIYEFDTFRLDTVNACLLREEEVIRLTPKVFDLLVLLVENHGRMLERDVLLDAIWSDAAVEEANLTQSISILRRSLGCGQNGQRYIETLPKRGYRFVAQVRIVDEEDELIIHKHTRAEVVIEEEDIKDEIIVPAATVAAQTIVTPATKPSITRSKLISRKILLAASIVLILIVVVIGRQVISKRSKQSQEGAPAALRKQSQAGVPAALRMNPLYSWKTEPGEAATGAAFSPDGKFIAFSASKDGHNDIWVKQIVGGAPIQILNDQWSDYNPLWSPDGQYIAFLSNRGNGLGAWVTPTFGGTPKLLKSFDIPPNALTHWSKDGNKIYYESQSNLYAFDLASAETTQITNFEPSSSSVKGFSLSYNENEIVYTDKQDNHSHLFVMPVQGGMSSQLTFGDMTDADPRWFADGERIVYSSNRAGVYQVCIAYKNGNESLQVTFGDSDARSPSPSPDQKNLLFISTKEEGNIFYCDINTGNEFEFTTTLGLQLWPDISPSGEIIAYQATSEKIKFFEGSIFTKPINSQGNSIEIAARGVDVQWSPDGSKLAFLRGSLGECTLWSVTNVGSEEEQLTINDIQLGGFTSIPYNRLQTKNYCWSPDSRKIAYCSTTSGQSNIWTVTSDGSTNTMISNNQDSITKFSCPLWSPDGTYLTYMMTQFHQDGKRTRSLWIRNKTETKLIFQSELTFRLIDWAKSGNEIYLAIIKEWVKGSQTQSVEILKISINGKTTEILGMLEQTYFYNIRLSPDGKTIAFASRADGRDNVWLFPTTGERPAQITKNTEPRVYLSSLTWSPGAKTIFYSKQKSWSLVTLIENFN